VFLSVSYNSADSSELRQERRADHSQVSNLGNIDTLAFSKGVENGFQGRMLALLVFSLGFGLHGGLPIGGPQPEAHYKSVPFPRPDLQLPVLALDARGRASGRKAGGPFAKDEPVQALRKDGFRHGH
jgi:hypothetical protein